MSLAILSVDTIYLDMNHELDFTSLGNEEKHMSEHNIDKDNIDIDVSSALNTDTTSDANTDTENLVNISIM